jgi:fluoroacetyl-CoA thioesterase
MPLLTGLNASVTMRVTDADTSISVGSGDVPVLATPRLVALAEQATVAAVASALEPGTTTVGYQVQLSHTAPTPVGGVVTADAILENIEGRRLTFRISAHDSRGLVGAGRVMRVVVVRDRFMEKARSES